MSLSLPLAEIKWIQKRYLKRLKKLGIETVRDLLFHFPHRYEDFSQISQISQIKINQRFCIKGRITKIENIRTHKKGLILTQAIISDKSGSVKAIWFNQPFLKNVLKKDTYLLLAGKLTIGKNESYLQNPIYEKIKDPDIQPFDPSLTHTGRIIPIYPETEGLTSRWFRFAIKRVLKKYLVSLKEPLPEFILKKYNLLPIREAILQIHFPSNFELANKAKERFAFQDLLILQLFVLEQRIKRYKEKSVSIPIKIETVKKFVDSLPFKLTRAQKKAAWQILKDMEKKIPMSRLLQGDVGSGKTIVVTIAALNCAKNGYQVAFMAPTEILAKQHFETVHNFLKNFNLNIGLLTSKSDRLFSKKLKNEVVEVSKRKLIELTEKGEIDILIGTHALIQDKVKFKKLGLVIVDEQHRFGVEQRAKLCKQTKTKERLIPHLLSMTATPIPRTLSLTIYGDLDISILDEMPRGKRKVNTIIVSPKERQKAYQLIEKEIQKGRQAFVICPRIEPGEKGETRAVKEEYKKLKEQIFPDFEIEMLHGKLSSKEKERIMRDFKEGKIDILVSTSVIEVGIDIPNATVMIVEGAERFGLAQLHQFRGRIGRGGEESYFFLFCESSSRKTQKRLKALVETDDGLKLAEVDLKLRGPGDFVGKRQWGIPDLSMEYLSDLNLVETTREAAREILEQDIYLKKFPLLKRELEKFKGLVHLE